jgi:hypothetical protein
MEQLGYGKLIKLPWFDDWSTKNDSDPDKFMPTSPLHHGWWTYPYYSCGRRAWLVSYSVPVLIFGTPRSTFDGHTRPRRNGNVTFNHLE